MTIVDVDDVAGLQPVRNLLTVLAGQHVGTLAEPRTYLLKRVAVRDDEIEFAAYNPMRDWPERRGGLGTWRICIRWRSRRGG